VIEVRRAQVGAEIASFLMRSFSEIAAEVAPHVGVTPELIASMISDWTALGIFAGPDGPLVGAIFREPDGRLHVEIAEERRAVWNPRRALRLALDLLFADRETLYVVVPRSNPLPARLARRLGFVLVAEDGEDERLSLHVAARRL